MTRYLPNQLLIRERRCKLMAFQKLSFHVLDSAHTPTPVKTTVLQIVSDIILLLWAPILLRKDFFKLIKDLYLVTYDTPPYCCIGLQMFPYPLHVIRWVVPVSYTHLDVYKRQLS